MTKSENLFFEIRNKYNNVFISFEEIKEKIVN